MEHVHGQATSVAMVQVVCFIQEGGHEACLLLVGLVSDPCQLSLPLYVKQFALSLNKLLLAAEFFWKITDLPLNLSWSKIGAR